MPRFLLYACLWIAGALAIVLGYGPIRAYYARLVAHGVTVQGVVTSINAKPRSTVDFEYAVGGQTFHERQHPFPPNTRPEYMRAGEAITLTYNSLEPKECFLGDPRPRLLSHTLFIVTAALFIPSVLVVLVASVLHRLPAHSSEPVLRAGH